MTNEGFDLVPIRRALNSCVNIFNLYSLLMVLLAAQDKPNGRLLSRPALIPVQPAQIQFHLALVSRIEAAQLQLNGHQAAQAAVVEEQIAFGKEYLES